MKYYVKENGQTITTSTININNIFSQGTVYTSSTSANDVAFTTSTTLTNIPGAEDYTFSTTEHAWGQYYGSIIASNFTIELESSDQLYSSNSAAGNAAYGNWFYSGTPTEDFYKGSYNVSLADGIWGISPAISEVSSYTLSRFRTVYFTQYSYSNMSTVLKFIRNSPVLTETTVAAAILSNSSLTAYDTASTIADNSLVNLSINNTIATLSTGTTYVNATKLAYNTNSNSWGTTSTVTTYYDTSRIFIETADIALLSTTMATYQGTLSYDEATSCSTSVVSASTTLFNFRANYTTSITSSITIDDNGETIFSTTNPVFTRTGSKFSSGLWIVTISDQYTTLSSVESNTYISYNEATTSYITSFTTTFGTASEFTYSTSTVSVSTAKETFSIEGTTITTDLEIGSLYSNGNYFYSTTFYGTLIGNNVDMTSWVYSADASTTSRVYEAGLSKVTAASTYKLFGDPLSSTSILQTTSTVSVCNVYETVTSGVMKTEVSSYNVINTIDVPVVYETNYTFTNSSTWWATTYIGPKEEAEAEEDDLYTYYNLDITMSATYNETGVRKSSSSEVISYYDTERWGTTARLSNLVASTSYINLVNAYGIQNYGYTYNVSNVWTFENTKTDVASTLDTYVTRLATSFTISYSTKTEALSYSFTATQFNAVVTTGERFIDKVEIYRTLTIGSYGRNTVAIYSGTTFDTISSNITGSSVTSSQDVSTVSRTFISSTADLDTTTEIASSDTASTFSGAFIYSSRELVSSTTEQQNDTLIFASTFNTYSFYNSSYTTSTLNTVVSTLSATTYEDWYNPVSWTSTTLSIATSTDVAETVNTASGVVSVTQSVDYTPIYSTTNGIFVTSE